MLLSLYFTWCNHQATVHQFIFLLSCRVLPVRIEQDHFGNKNYKKQKCMGGEMGNVGKQVRNALFFFFLQALFHRLSPALRAPASPLPAGGESVCMCVQHCCIQDHWMVTTVRGGIKIRQSHGSLHFYGPAVGYHSVLDVCDGLENPGV